MTSIKFGDLLCACTDWKTSLWMWSYIFRLLKRWQFFFLWLVLLN